MFYTLKVFCLLTDLIDFVSIFVNVTQHNKYVFKSIPWVTVKCAVNISEALLKTSSAFTVTVLNLRLPWILIQNKFSYYVSLLVKSQQMPSNRLKISCWLICAIGNDFPFLLFFVVTIESTREIFFFAKYHVLTFHFVEINYHIYTTVLSTHLCQIWWLIIAAHFFFSGVLPAVVQSIHAYHRIGLQLV